MAAVPTVPRAIVPSAAKTWMWSSTADETRIDVHIAARAARLAGLDRGRLPLGTAGATAPANGAPAATAQSAANS